MRARNILSKVSVMTNFFNLESHILSMEFINLQNYS